MTNKYLEKIASEALKNEKKPGFWATLGKDVSTGGKLGRDVVLELEALPGRVLGTTIAIPVGVVHGSYNAIRNGVSNFTQP